MYGEGDLVNDPALADTLENIAKNGPEDFYRGSLADKFVADMKKQGQ